MVSLTNIMQECRPFKALVIGDFMMDAYVTGRVKRISPEAPVPILEVLHQRSRPGGAGNVVLNLLALGGSVIAVGRIGSDAQGEELRRSLQEKGADVEPLFVENEYQTPVKTRLIAESQQLLRIDREKVSAVSRVVANRACEKLEALIASVQVVAISDYAKGFLSNRLIEETIRIAKKYSVPVVIDPKGIDFTKYKGASILKPNLAEAYASVKAHSSTSLDEVARQIFKTASVDQLLVTRSEEGMSLFDQQGARIDFPVRTREVKDVTGAGDTVLAVISLAMANRLELPLAVQLANIAAGISVERLGCVQVGLSEIAERITAPPKQTSPA
ncbi:MAG: D-glycero-beta-D-manno-heptose-7-phosphate kinase [Chlamydiia bacterium]|nr:D-glycero-beta-D-manno-heptose-7-phosphate kinase [Chlamydiia bacterium]